MRKWIIFALAAVAAAVAVPASVGHAASTAPHTVYVSTAGVDSTYFWHTDMAIGIWNAKPSATNVQLVNIGNQGCPSINTSTCIAIGTSDFGRSDICGATTRSTIGSHSYASVSINTECWPASEYQRLTMVVHEIGHGLGVGGANDPGGACNIMSDTSSCVYQYQVPDEYVLDEVGQAVN